MSFYEHLASTVNSPGGILAYHTVLSFSIAGALISAFNVWRQRKYPQGYRMVLGLSFLLGIRILLLAGSALVGMTETDIPPILYILDQAAYILGFIFIFWLWGYPEPHRSADTSVTLLSLLTLFLTLYHVFAEANHVPSLLPGFTWIELIWYILGWGLVLLGGGVLLQRKPNGWQYGLGMSAILSLGYLVHGFFPHAQNEFSASIRLAHMAAYPLITALPFRFALTKSIPRTEPAGPEVETRRKRTNIDLPVMETILDFSPQLDPSGLYRSIVKLTSHAIVADICLMVETPGPQGDVEILSGFDLIRQEHIQSLTVESKKVPLLSTFIRREQTLHLPASSTSRDLINLSYILQLKKSGHLLATPIQIPGSTSPKGLVLLSPFSERQWIKEDQEYLTGLVTVITTALSRETGSPTHATEKLQHALRQMKGKVQDLQREKQTLQAKISRLKGVLGEQHKADLGRGFPKTAWDELQRENEALQQRIDRLSSMVFADTEDQLRGHLKIALEEISSLKEDLAQAERELDAVKGRPSQELALTDSRQKSLAAFVQEVQEPLESLVHYSDLLFDQSIHVLNSMQKKMLQRIKSYRDQIDNLMQGVMRERTRTTGQAATPAYQADFKHSLHKGLNANREQIQGNELSVQIDVPQTLLPLDMPQGVLDDIILILLANAAHQTYPGGTIELTLRVHQVDSNQSFAHIRVKDEGEGFASSELPYVIDQSEGEKDADQGQPQSIRLNLSSVKDMVEEHEGRIWVDSHPKRGNVISLLLPFVPQPLGRDAGS